MKKKLFIVWFRNHTNEEKYFQNKENAILFVKDILNSLNIQGVNTSELVEDIHYGIIEKEFED